VACHLMQVRSRRKRKFCVACSLYVVDPTEAAAAAEKAAAEQQKAASVLPGEPPAAPLSPQPPSPASMAQPAPERGVAGGGGGGNDELGRVAHDCIAALTHKLDQYTTVRARSASLMDSPRSRLWAVLPSAAQRARGQCEATRVVRRTLPRGD
jgi:hypothetical protein